TIQAQILDLLAELRERLGMAMILITHDLGVVAQVCDRVVVMYAGQVVEEASVDDLFREPRHPYTEGLLKAIPRLGKPVERLAVIPGTVPSPTAWPVSCRFHPRCPYGWDLCVEAAPELFPAGEGRASRCWLEKHPERREEVRRRTGAYDASRAGRADAPAERWHGRAAAEHAAPGPEIAPPDAPARPPMGEPDVAEDVERRPTRRPHPRPSPHPRTPPRIEATSRRPTRSSTCRPMRSSMSAASRCTSRSARGSSAARPTTYAPSTTSPSGSAAARRSGWSASPGPARPRPDAPYSASSSRPRGRLSSMARTSSAWTTMNCAACGAGRRSSSRTRSGRSTPG